MRKIDVFKLSVVVLTITAFLGLFNSASAATKTKSTNWAGYKVEFSVSSGQKVDRVSGGWVVPSVQASVEFRQVSEWIGIGYNSSDLVQIGTLQTSVRGQVTYSAWYQRLPEDLESVDITQLDGKVDPGTAIDAVVEKGAGDSWILVITAGNVRVQKKVAHFGSQQLSAEWIVELPTPVLRSRRMSRLADFGNVTFTAARATVNGDASMLKDLPYGIDELVDSPFSDVLASTSNLSEDGESFVVTYEVGNTMGVGDFIISQAPYVGVAAMIAGEAVGTTVLMQRFKNRKKKR